MLRLRKCFFKTLSFIDFAWRKQKREEVESFIFLTYSVSQPALAVYIRMLICHRAYAFVKFDLKSCRNARVFPKTVATSYSPFYFSICPFHFIMEMDQGKTTYTSRKQIIYFPLIGETLNVFPCHSERANEKVSSGSDSIWRERKPNLPQSIWSKET